MTTGHSIIKKDANEVASGTVSVQVFLGKSKIQQN